MIKETPQSPFADYFQAVQYLEGLSNLSDIEVLEHTLGLEVSVLRMRDFLDRIGSPDKGIKLIHVSGTSGKGTVCSMIHSILVQDGHEAGLYTSPSSTVTIERIKVGNLYIAPEEFVDCITWLKPYIDDYYLNGRYGQLHFGNICLALAFIYFQRKNCEWAMIEVGSGGRFNLTNAIIDPVITAITNIDLDHTRLLGKTLTKIAHHKAGIIKPGSTFFTTENRPRLVRLFRQICADLNVPMIRVKSDELTNSSNQKLAIAIGEHLKLSETAIRKGITESQLPCRFEVMQRNPTVILDGAHNPAKIRSVSNTIKRLSYKNLWVILALSNNKDIESILKIIVPQADHLIITRHEVKEKRPASPRLVSRISKKYLKRGATLFVTLDPRNAWKKTKASAQREDLILATGSFYFTGQIREEWYPKEWVLAHRTSFKP
jgi:dihydrofolate synthase/folylpolyglutamate synthase